jgi:cytochrome c-type biogenesis protein CcmE
MMAESSTILKGAVSTSKANNKVKFIVGGLVIVGLIAYLIISSVQQAGAYYREVGEVLAQKDALVGKNLRVSGNIVTNSVTYDAAKMDLNFVISDPTDANKTLPVYFHGVKPDQITREGASAIIEGSLSSSGGGNGNSGGGGSSSNSGGGSNSGKGGMVAGAGATVVASNLLLKCPSRYEEQGIEEVKVEAVK